MGCYKNPLQNEVVEHMNRPFWSMPEHADTRRIAQAVVGRCSQHDGVSDKERTFSASELWGSGGSMD